MPNEWLTQALTSHLSLSWGLTWHYPALPGRIRDVNLAQRLLCWRVMRRDGEAQDMDDAPETGAIGETWRNRNPKKARQRLDSADF